MRVLVTGGAGFIGSHICDYLLKEGHYVVVLDNMSLGSKRNVEHMLRDEKFLLVEGDILDQECLDSVFAQKFECVFHMAANSDIARSHASPEIDFDNTFLTTFRLLTAMRHADVKKLVFASTSAVYGEAIGRVSESYGPLNPISHYGASKLASEAFISSFCENYDFQSWIVRFPNVVGPRATHGAVFDFVNKLLQTPSELNVLGDGTQEKPYLYVLELVSAIMFIWRNAGDKFNAYNIGPDTQTKVADIARFVIEASGLSSEIRYSGGARGWVGDVPKFAYDSNKLVNLGWEPSLSSDEAVRAAAKAIWDERR